jgi:hypothetical protein
MNMLRSKSASSQSEPSESPVQLSAKPRFQLKRVWSVSLVTVVLAAAGAVAWLWAQGPQLAFGLLVASPPNFVFNTPTTVTFTIPIHTPTLNPSSVELLQVDADGRLLARVGRMYDNGQGGDVTPGDRNFTAIITLNESEIGRLYFRVAAAFRGNRQNDESASVFVDVDPVPLPPDPGEDGKVTLEGIDSDGDGLRDDVQRWIILNFLTSLRMQLALRDTAVATQNALASTNSPTAQAAVEHELSATRCLVYINGASKAYELVSELDDLILNTDQRVSAYDEYEARVDSRLLTTARLTELHDFCPFDPDSLPN